VYRFLSDGENEGERLTHGALESKARAIATRLQEIIQGATCAVLLYPPGLEYIAAFYGCLFAGVPAVPAYPPDPARLGRTLPRLQSIIADSGATIILTNAAILGMAEAVFQLTAELGARTWLATDTIDESRAADWKPPCLSRESIAFLQYTSGSTAQPRGVVLTHGNLLHNQELIRQAFGSSPDTVGVGWLPLYHDMGLIGNVLHPVYAGFPVVLMSPLHFLQRPLRWLLAMTRYRATASGGPNFAYDICTRKVSDAEIETLDLRSWDLAFNGAEIVRAETLERFADRFARTGFRSTAFYPCYGLAEASLIVSGGIKGRRFQELAVDRDLLAGGAASVVEEGAQSRTLVGCGRALGDGRVVVVDIERREPVAPGELGEIWVRSPSVAVGYWGKPQLTEQIFRARLVGNEEETFLRTGDLGFLHDGELFVAGRHKDLIIVRGRNVYPQDLERSVEACHPSIRPGCVAAFSVDSRGEEHIVVVAEIERRLNPNRSEPQRISAFDPVKPAPYDSGSIVRAIRSTIADDHGTYVGTVILLGAGTIPKTSSGKIQHHACKLAFAEGTLVELFRDEAPTTELAPPPALPDHDQPESAPPESRRLIAESLRAGIARAARIPVEEVEPSRTIATFGFDSLAALELQFSLETELGVVFPMTTLLGGSTVEQAEEELLALSLRASRHTSRPSEAPAMQGMARRVPVSLGQERLWFFDELAPGSPVFNVSAAWSVQGPIDFDALRYALGVLIERHEMLRVTFPASDGQPCCSIAETLDAPLEIVDYRACPHEEARERAMHAVAACERSSFDLKRGPAWRLLCARIRDDEQLLALCFHHIVADAWSLGVFVEELTALYGGHVADVLPSLAPLPTRFAEFARWQRSRVTSEEGENDETFWRGQLKGAPAFLDLPRDRKRPTEQSYRGRQASTELSVALTSAVDEIARRSGCTPFVVLLSALIALLRRQTGESDLVVGVPVSGRAYSELRSVVGFFVNMLPVRVAIGGDPTFAQLLECVRHAAYEAYAHQNFPFERIVNVARPVRDFSRTPIFQVAFNMLSTMHIDSVLHLALPGTRTELLDPSEESIFAKFDLEMYVARREGHFAVRLVWNETLFEQTRMRDLLDQYVALLSQSIAAPQDSIAGSSLMTPFLRGHLGHPSRVAHAWEGGVGDALARWAEIAPASVAIDGSLPVTYGELDTSSHRLARALRDRGLRPGDRVAIQAARQPSLIVALVACLRARTPFVIVDPSHPPRRSLRCLEAAKPRAWISCTAAMHPDLERFAGTLFAVPIDAPAADNPLEPAEPDDEAYVAFTSGSTGIPKGVLGTQAPLSHFFSWQASAWRLNARTRVSMLGGLSHDPLLRDVLGPLWSGGACCVPPFEKLEDGERIANGSRGRG